MSPKKRCFVLGNINHLFGIGGPRSCVCEGDILSLNGLEEQSFDERRRPFAPVGSRCTSEVRRLSRVEL